MNSRKFYENPQIALIKMFGSDVFTSEDSNNGIGEDFGENDGEWT